MDRCQPGCYSKKRHALGIAGNWHTTESGKGFDA
ncbi:hypothetical protein XF_1331 [Xylella fastidiosa 9a5c]|uniref:Uncharacterized protein n=1 Tax=Xylella fastidiosa (strain 9a5c) TaxID=160492 RepID=Q9PDP8_XYLFA|nr:hypothetical protein XF_1331 [Xylella fastidiosa 9a5c]